MTTSGKTNYHHGNLREQLLEAALNQLRNEGMEQLSLRALARELGVSQTAPYRHFSDKNALIAALAQDGFVRLGNAMRKGIAEAEGTPEAQLQGTGIAYIAFARSSPELYRLMFGQPILDISQYPDLQTSANDTFGLLRDAIGRCIENGIIAKTNIEMLANTAWALVHGLSTLILDRLQYQMSEDMIQQQIQLATQMLFTSGRL